MFTLSINNLFFKYNKDLVFDDLCLNIREGEKVGLIGANGSGKTTLFLSICGILAPDKGVISLLGKVVKKGFFYPEIGLIFQNPDDQLFCHTVKDDIIFGAQNLGLSSLEIEERFIDVLRETGVEYLQNRVSHQLSGGEKCMVAIASVLIMRPKMILYDEPSANLDLRARRRLIKFLQSCQETIMISSHDLELITEVCDRTILINNGKIIADGDPSKIMSNKSLMENNCLEVPASLK